MMNQNGSKKELVKNEKDWKNRLKMRKSGKGYLALKLLIDKTLVEWPWRCPETQISIPEPHKKSREKQGRGKMYSQPWYKVWRSLIASRRTSSWTRGLMSYTGLGMAWLNLAGLSASATMTWRNSSKEGGLRSEICYTRVSHNSCHQTSPPGAGAGGNTTDASLPTRQKSRLLWKPVVGDTVGIEQDLTHQGW